MPEFRVTDPDSGVTLKITGDSPPTESELEEIFAQYRTSEMPEDSALARAQRGDPTEGMSGTQNFLSGMGKSFADLGRGAMDLVGLADDEELARIKERDAPLMSTGTGVAGNIVGSVAAFAPTAMMPGVNTMRGAAALGAGIGALTPTTEDESRLSNMAIGGVLGGATQGAISGVGKAKNALTPLFSPRTAAKRTLNTVAGPRRDAIVNALRSNTDTLATAGEAAAPAGSAEFSALMKMSQRGIPSEAVERGAQQASRRTDLLSTALRTGNLDDFISKRSAATDPLYEAVRNSTREVDTTGLVRSIDKAIRENKTRDILVGELRRIRGKLTQTQTPTRRSISRAANQSTTTNQTSVRDLYSTRQSIKDVLDKNSGPEALPKTITNQLLGVKDSIDEALSSASDEFAQASSRFRSLSEPVNQAEVGNTLLDALNAPVTDLGRESGQRAAGYASALRNAPQTIQKSTGFRAGRELSDVLTKNQMQVVRDVGEELAKKGNYEDLARAGGYSAKEAMEAVDVRLPGILERNVVIANSILGRASTVSQRKIIREIAKISQDPQKVAELMDSVSPVVADQVEAIIRQLRTAATTTAASSGT